MTENMSMVDQAKQMPAMVKATGDGVDTSATPQKAE